MKKEFKNNRKPHSGFSLIEVLIALSIFVVVGGLIALFSRNVFVYSTFISNGLTNSDSGKLVLRGMVSEIRTASSADTGSYAISQASATSFTFYSNIDKDALKEKVRYFLSAGVMQKGITKPSGTPLTYNPANEKISTLVGNITNASIFSYYDKFYDGQSASLPSPVNISSVRLVKITITTDRDPNRPPAPATFTTQVSIRNLKDNL